MADTFTKEQRSHIMSQIKSRNTKLEVSFLKLLSAELYPRGYRYRKHHVGLVGKPDVVFVGHKVAVFVDGDFWHGYNFSKLGKKLPNAYWRDKIKNNMARDKKVNRLLKKDEWKVLRFWEHEVQKNPERAVLKIEAALNGQSK